MHDSIRCQIAAVNAEISCARPSRYATTDGTSPLMLCNDHIKYIATMYEKIIHRDLFKVNIITVEDPDADKNLNEIRYLEAHLKKQRERNAELSRENRKLRGEKVEPRPQDPNQEGHIYILRVGGCYKIGWTSNLKNRMRSYHPDTTLMCVYPGTRADEKKLHKKWAHYLRNGREWFMLAPEIDRHIEQKIKQHGEPEKVDFSAKIRAA